MEGKDPWNADDVLFPHEKLDAAEVADELVEFTEAVKPCFANHPKLYDQLERAADSVLERLSEGAASYYKGEKRKLYSTSRASAAECAAVLKTSLKRGVISEEQHQKGRRLAARLFMMLTKLVLSQAEP